MFKRELTKREREIYDMIPDDKDDLISRSIVDIVRSVQQLVKVSPEKFTVTLVKQE